MDNAILTLEDLVKAVKAEAAAEQAGPAEQPSSTAFVINETADSDAGQQKTDAVVRRLVMFIFEKHPRNSDKPLLKELLFSAAQASGIGPFTHGDFDAAYRAVYHTKRSHPPVGGWELREPYKTALAKETRTASPGN
jgi:hypothetical protein